MTDQGRDVKSELALLKLCSAALDVEFPLGSWGVLSDGTLVEVVGIGGVSFGDKELKLPIFYGVLATPEQLAEEEVDLDVVGIKRLPETEYACEHGTVPVDLRESGRIEAAATEDILAELRDQTFNVRDGLIDSD